MNMNHSSLYYPWQWPQPHHCTGCRCFAQPSTWTHTITTPYQPRHRKPGPAQ